MLKGWLDGAKDGEKEWEVSHSFFSHFSPKGQILPV